MFLHIEREIMLSYFPWGCLYRRLSLGGSVARARDAKVSMIRFTHNIWMLFKGELLSTTEPRNAITRATKFTVSWN